MDNILLGQYNLYIKKQARRPVFVIKYIFLDIFPETMKIAVGSN